MLDKTNDKADNDAILNKLYVIKNLSSSGGKLLFESYIKPTLNI